MGRRGPAVFRGSAGRVLGGVLAATCLLLPRPGADVAACADGAPAEGDARPPAAAADQGCVRCHGGIEEMHPWAPLGCVECHGGDGRATSKDAAHVAPLRPPPGDERTAPLDEDPAYRRFVNPTDLRVAAKTCGRCHAGWCSDVRTSLHATTAGHLSDGLYENGVVAKRVAVGIFPVVDPDGPQAPRALKELKGVAGFAGGPPGDVATHYRDVARKSCMQCHLWSRGRAVRGRLGMDGDYRSEGCAACHLTYSDRGFSESADPTIDRREPGHPLRHEMTAAPPTATCTRCHYGDAAIGLGFRGLTQLVPGQPAGPDVPGTTPERLNGVFYGRDDAVGPPDVHHERGMDCVDCHTARDVMGDGDLHPNMDRAVEIECDSCHGTFEARTRGRTARGDPVPNLSFEGADVVLTSKRTGVKRRVKQARDVVDPLAPDFNPRAREAMTGVHGRLECYACHAGWNANFFGFHFDRNETFTQLDVLSGERTPGRTTTQEKVFATFRRLTLGLNHEGRFAPYLVGFSTFCSATDRTGRVVVDHGMPRTAAGLSGMTMIHHQPHTTRREARQCAECHRAGAAYGLGSRSFALARGIAVAATTRGAAVIAVDRKTPERSVVLAEARVGGPAADVALVVDPVDAHAVAAYVATSTGLAVLDMAIPAAPAVTAQVPLLGGARRVVALDRYAYVATGSGAVAVVDLKDRLKPAVAAVIPCRDARDLVVAGLRLFVADGVAGLAVVDVSDPTDPRIVATLPVPDAAPGAPAQAIDVDFRFSRPLAGGGRTRARQIAAVGGAGYGLRLLDVTEPARPRPLEDAPEAAAATAAALRELRAGRRPVALRFTSKFDLGTPGGGVPSAEHEDLYVATVGEGGEGRLFVVRTTNPEAPVVVDRIRLDGAPTGLELLKTFNAPFLVHGAAVPTVRGLQIVDATRTGQGAVKATLRLPAAGGVAVEAMAFDRMITEEGRPLKDIAHEDAAYVDGALLRRLLSVPLPPPPAPAAEPRAEDK